VFNTADVRLLSGGSAKRTTITPTLAGRRNGLAVQTNLSGWASAMTVSSSDGYNPLEKPSTGLRSAPRKIATASATLPVAFSFIVVSAVS
jgi:hypothetical protein